MKKIFAFINNTFNKIKTNYREKHPKKKFNFVKLGIFGFILILFFVLIIIIVTGKVKFPTHKAYDKTGFIEYKNLTKNEYVLENDLYKFSIDKETTHFDYLDKTSNITYTSYSTSSKKQDTLTLYYSASKGTAKDFSNYNYSINYEGEKRYLIKEVNNTSIEVLYLLGGKIKIDYTDLPALISTERYLNYLAQAEELLNSDTLTEEEKTELNVCIKTIKSSYHENNKVENPYYALDNPSNQSERYITRIYNYFYKYLGYTIDDLYFDNAEHGSTLVKDYPKFEIAIRYELTNDGLQITLVNDSIVEYESHPLVYIDLLPYFGCASSTDSGYAMIPDGSGILLDFNSSRSYASHYESRIYGDDLARVVTTGGYDIDKVNFGLYGMNFNNDNKSYGYLNIIKNSEESCSIIGSMNTKGIGDNNFNRVYYRYFYRESDTYVFASLSNQNTIRSWTNEFNQKELVVLIKPLSNDASYSTMAKVYQQYLIDNNVLSVNNQNKLQLNIEMIGGYLHETNFLGFPYSKVEALTTPNDILNITNQLLDNNISNINIFYDSYFNEGINQTNVKKIQYSSSITTRRKLKTLISNLNNKNVTLIPTMRVASGYSKKNINNNEQIRNMYGALCPHYRIDLATFEINLNTTPLYYVKPSSYGNNFKQVNKELNKINSNNLSLIDLGNVCYGSYKSKEIIFRSDMLDSFNQIMNQEINNFQIYLNNPSMYALKYTKNVYDLSYSGTSYQVVQTSVPFYQLLLSGCINYSGNSININDQYNFNYYKLKSIETLSNIQMTWTGIDTIDLIDTEFNYYYSTYYQNWIDDTIKLYQELNNLNIYNFSLVSHQLLDNNGNVTISKYSNGKEIIFNYLDSEYTYLDKVVKPNSYLVLKEGN